MTDLLELVNSPGSLYEALPPRTDGAQLKAIEGSV